MTTEKIGRVKTGSGKTWVVAWNSTSGEVYCGPSGATFRVGKAKSIGEAMKLAEAYCYNK